MLIHSLRLCKDKIDYIRCYTLPRSLLSNEGYIFPQLHWGLLRSILNCRLSWNWLLVRKATSVNATNPFRGSFPPIFGWWSLASSPTQVWLSETGIRGNPLNGQSFRQYAWPSSLYRMRWSYRLEYIQNCGWGWITWRDSQGPREREIRSQRFLE